jgi:hypothetical protein
MQDLELSEYAWQILQELPQEAQTAFIRQNAQLVLPFVAAGIGTLAAIAAQIQNRAMVEMFATIATRMQQQALCHLAATQLCV